MDLRALAGQLRFQPWRLTRCPPAGPSSSCLFQAPSPMALSTSSPAFGPSHCPPSETVSCCLSLSCHVQLAQHSLSHPRPSTAWLPTTCFPPALCCETTPLWGPDAPLHWDPPQRLHASHAPSPLDLGIAFLPQHPAWCPQAHSCRPAPLGLWVSTFRSAAGKGGPSLSGIPLPSHRATAECHPTLPPHPHPRPRQLEASGFKRWGPASGGLAAQVPALSAQISSGVRGASPGPTEICLSGPCPPLPHLAQFSDFSPVKPYGSYGCPWSLVFPSP